MDVEGVGDGVAHSDGSREVVGKDEGVIPFHKGVGTGSGALVVAVLGIVVVEFVDADRYVLRRVEGGVEVRVHGRSGV